MPQRTNPFQKLTAAIFSVFHEPEYEVVESVLMQNPRTGVTREIDIKVMNRSNPNDRFMIECRAHKRRQDVQWIDALEGKSRSLGFTKTIAVSASGFSKQAIIEAHDRKIETLHLRKAEEIDWRKWIFAIENIGFEIDGAKFLGVIFDIDANWPGEIPEISDYSRLILVDTRDNSRIPLLSWAKELLNDPVTINELRSIEKSAQNTPLNKVFPCAVGMGFVIEGIEEFVPLAQLTVNINYHTSSYKVPLDHMKIGEDRLLVGTAPILGVETRVVMHEKKNGVKILISHEKK